MKKEELEAIGGTMRKHDLDSWEVNKDLSVKKTAAGTYRVFDSGGGLLDIETLTEGQTNQIRAMFEAKGGELGGDKHDFDKNFLIPDDSDFGVPITDGSIADKKDRKKEDKIDWDSNFLIPD